MKQFYLTLSIPATAQTDPLRNNLQATKELSTLKL